MPRQKDFKRRVRARMAKTGESYTTARAHLLRAPRSIARPDALPSAAPLPDVALGTTPPSLEQRAGVRDDALKARTGCTWARWVHALDRRKAHELPHREIARLVADTYQLDSWWAQAVTVGYERIKGLRAHGQKRGGAWEASKTRTYAVPLTTLFEAWAGAVSRSGWLRERVSVRSTIPPRSLRLGLADGTIVHATFIAKGDAKSAVTITHMKLTSAADREGRRAFWAGRLDALRTHLDVSPVVVRRRRSTS